MRRTIDTIIAVIWSLVFGVCYLLDGKEIEQCQMDRCAHNVDRTTGIFQVVGKMESQLSPTVDGVMTVDSNIRNTSSIRCWNK